MPVTAAATLFDELTRLVGSAREARWILEEVGGAAGPAGPGPLGERQVAAARDMAARRRAGEPLQYVFGHWPFRTLDLLVDPRVLIPRPETEQVVEVALAELAEASSSTRRRPSVAVDLGTGSGAIALSLAAEGAAIHRGLTVWATDVDPGALAVAGANLDRLVADRPALAGTVRLAAGRWWSAVPGELAGRIDLVVSNPPYVAEEEWADLPVEVRLEPRGALVSAATGDGIPGLGDVESVLHGAADRLAPAGAVVVELAPHQAAAARSMARALGFDRVRVARDLAGRDRALVARR